jgi:hypothetical protein
MPRREATAYVVGVIGKTVADLAQPNPALAAALKEFFVRTPPERNVSEGLMQFYVEVSALDMLAGTGKLAVTLDFAYDDGGVGKGGKATLYVNGKPVAEGRVDRTQPNIFSADETADVGIDNQTPVAEGIGIGPETRFTGTINKVTLEVGK